MKQIVTDNTELLEVLEANGINIICNSYRESAGSVRRLCNLLTTEGKKKV